MLTGFWHLWFLWKLFGEWPGSGSRWGLWRQKKWQIEKEGDREREETLIQVVPPQIQSILCQKLSKSPKYRIYSVQIIINIREDGGRGSGGVGGGGGDVTFMISGTIWSTELQRQKWRRLHSVWGVCLRAWLRAWLKWRQRLGKNRRTGNKNQNKRVWGPICVPLTFVMQHFLFFLCSCAPVEKWNNHIPGRKPQNTHPYTHTLKAAMLFNANIFFLTF